MAARFMDVAGVGRVALGCLRAEGPIHDDFGKTKDRIERCPQLVTDIRQELRFGAVRNLQLAGALLDSGLEGVVELPRAAIKDLNFKRVADALKKLPELQRLRNEIPRTGAQGFSPRIFVGLSR